MSVPSKANIDKPDNPARPKTNHPAGTSSAWQTSALYTDSDLNPSTQYT